MVLRLPDKWVWDFWFVQRDEEHHLFYLQAPRALGDPALRHHNATIGHAVSADCHDWQVLPDALQPGVSGNWDDLATWTGSTIGYEGRWYMLYTGVNRAEGGLVQRIGLAASDDLVHWDKHPGNPVLEVDPEWYEVLDQGRWRDQSWRDPWLFRSPYEDLFHVLITARYCSGPPDGAGVIAHARSADLINWEILPPLTEPGEFAQVEVPQLLQLDGHSTIVFSCLAEDHSRARIDRLSAPGRTGTFAFSARTFLGPYLPSDAPVAEHNGRLGTLYAGKLLEGQPGEYSFMAFRGDGDRDFLGELTDLLPVRLGPNGHFVVLTN
jgi:beta-fructofuranosidase